MWVLQRINTALASTDWLVLVLTPAAVQSHPVNTEVNAAVNLAWQRRMRGVIPIVAKPCEPADIPPTWAILQRYDATHDYHAALAGLLRALSLPASAPVPVGPTPGAAAPSPGQALPPLGPASAPAGAVAWLAGHGRPLVAILAAVLIVGVLAVLLSPGRPNAGASSTTAAIRTANANASATTGAARTALAVELATRTAKTVRFPYVAPAPGPGCDTGAVPWGADNTGVAVFCESNPTRTHLVLTCSSPTVCGSGFSVTSYASVPDFNLPRSYTVSVDVSGVSSCCAGGAALALTSSTLTPNTTRYQLWLGADGSYYMCREKLQGCTTVGQGSANTGTKTSLALQVSSSGVRGSVNGTVVATVADMHVATNSITSLELIVTGSSGAQADFSNFSITQL